VPGGYVGVDVFFVISGFLITGQLARELRETGTISFRGFYARRARRILPAATLTTIVTVALSGLLMSPLPALRVLGDARAAAVFGANIHFAARDADYFSSDLPPSPLQHYWSLSVEEQFYLVWPLLLLASSLAWLGVRRHKSAVGSPARGHDNRAASIPTRTRPRIVAVYLILATLAALSFVASVRQTAGSPTWAYYSIVTRAWELAAGALVALSLPVTQHLDKRLAAAFTWIGVTCIAIAALVFNSSTPYPGAAALLPVAGAAVIIAAGSGARHRWSAEAVLGTPPFQRVGAWSYSWYLWHWPVLVLAPLLFGHSLSRPEALTMAALSLVVAIISYICVERPIRRIQVIVRRPSLGLVGGAALIATLLAVVTLASPVFASLRYGPPAKAPTLTGTNSMAAELAADLREGVATRRVPANLEPSLMSASQDKSLIAQNGCLVPIGAAGSTSACVYGDVASRTSVVLFGDSHAAAWFPALNMISSQEHWRLVVLTKSGCPAAAVNLIRFGRPYASCPVWRNDVEKVIAALHPALVVVAYSQYMHGARPLAGVPTGYGSTWQNGTEATFSFLHRAAAQVLFITDVPMLPEPAPDCVSGHLADVRPCAVARTAAVRYPHITAEELALAARNGIHTLDVTPWFCTSRTCPVIVGNILLYRDAQHMVPEWSTFLAPLLARHLVPLVPPQTGAQGGGTSTGTEGTSTAPCQTQTTPGGSPCGA
jgi:peptidoglycan/LPS O-acetylase OafA/YrhL